MSPFLITMLVIVVVLAIVCVGLYFLGRKLKKRQDEQQAIMDSMAQNVTMLIIDKKRMRLRDANGLPKQVTEQIPKYLRRAKMPVVKAKIGPRVMTMLCDEKIFEVLPVGRQVKAVISGLYITSVKSIRGSITPPAPKPKGLKRLTARFKKSAQG